MVQVWVLVSSLKAKQGGVSGSHCDLAIYIKKYSNEKKRRYGNSNISPWNNQYKASKESSKRNQNPLSYY